MSGVKQKFTTMQFKVMTAENKIISDLNSDRFYLIKTEPKVTKTHQLVGLVKEF